MTTKGKIKVIKKNEVRETSPVVNTENVEKKSNRESARVMVSTVTNWVSDFQILHPANTGWRSLRIALKRLIRIVIYSS
jgi:hypothetical protein